MAEHSNLNRVALISELVRRAPASPGRTALMKFLFFLKELKGVPLPYDFRLYTYGPFDSDVLDDLRYAESLGAVRSTLVAYPGGRGYEYQAGPEADQIRERAGDFLARHDESVECVLGEFGDRTALDLEMASTLIYVDRSSAKAGARRSLADLVKRTHDVKPHLAIKAIEQEAAKLEERGLLTALT